MPHPIIAMAEGNGEVSLEVTGQDCDTRTPDFHKLLEYGLDSKVAIKLDDIYKTGKLAHIELDERALDALIEFPVEGALNVLGQFLDSNLEHVSNKSAYLCGVMKTYRQKTRAVQQGGPMAASVLPAKGPDDEKIKLILLRTGYTLDVTTGQRKYGGPPPGWEGNTPGAGCEVFCGKIPKDMYEDELIPLFENCGAIWDLRLMMDPMTGTNRGYAFVTFTTRDAAQNAVRELDNHEIKPGKSLKINISVPNLRLFVGNIPKSKGKEEILEEFAKLAAGLMDVIIYSSPDDKKKNRGFCFLEYESHKQASLAKRRLGSGRFKPARVKRYPADDVWTCDIIVDWADPQEEPDEQTMSKVKVLYVRNLTQDTSEDTLKDVFEGYGKVERVKKLKDYAFVHFEDRDCAVKAMRDLDGKDMGGAHIEVSLAKPPSDKKKKEEMLRARERRMMQMLHGRGGGCSPSGVGGVGGVGGPVGRGGRPNNRGPLEREEYDYDYDYYGYGGYRGGYTEPYYGYDELYFDYAAPAQGQPSRNRPPPGGRGAGVRPGRGAGGAPVGPGQAGGERSPGGPRVDRGPPAPTTARTTGNPRAKGSLPGKRKWDGSHQNQGGPGGAGGAGKRRRSVWDEDDQLPQLTQPLPADEGCWETDSCHSWT